MSKTDCFLLGQQSQSCCTITKINANEKAVPGIHGQKYEEVWEWWKTTCC